MEAQARALLALGPKAVLLKGGHGSGREAVDILVDARRPAGAPGAAAHRLRATRTAPAARYRPPSPPDLARGDSLPVAVAFAKRFVHDALNAGRNLKIGGGSGPVDHLHTVRGPRKS